MQSEPMSHESVKPLADLLNAQQDASLHELDAAFVEAALSLAPGDEDGLRTVTNAYSIVGDRVARVAYIRDYKRTLFRRKLESLRGPVIGSLFILALLAPVAYFAFPRVPDVQGMAPEQATRLLASRGLEASETLRHSDTTAGVTIGTIPARGTFTWRESNTPVGLLVSVGPTDTAHASSDTTAASTCIDQCHEAKECRQCHGKKKVQSRTHRKSWTGKGGHAASAKKRAVSCEVCHQGSGSDVNGKFCVGCHKVKLPHPGGPNTTWHKVQGRKKTVCVKCHQKKQCDSCHRAEAAKKRAAEAAAAKREREAREAEAAAERKAAEARRKQRREDARMRAALLTGSTTSDPWNAVVAESFQEEENGFVRDYTWGFDDHPFIRFYASGKWADDMYYDDDSTARGTWRIEDGELRITTSVPDFDGFPPGNAFIINIDGNQMTLTSKSGLVWTYTID